MTPDEAKEYLIDISHTFGNMSIEYLTEKDGEKMREAIKALNQEPCEDAISRQAVLDMMQMRMSGKELYKAVYELPPVTSQSKTGRWVLKRIFPTKLYDEHLNEYECSECDRRIRCTESQLVNYPYCHCGAKMELESEV